MKWLFNLLSDYRTDCNMPFGHEDVVVGELLATQGKLYKTKQLVQRVRELHKPIDDDGLPPVNVRCQECGYYDYWPCATIQALDGEQE